MWHRISTWTSHVAARVRRLPWPHMHMPVLPRPPKWIWRALVILAILAIAAAVVSGPVSLANPKMCTSCHVPARAYDQWRNSPHASVACGKCHTDRASLLGLGNTVAVVSNLLGSSGQGPEVTDEACISCHPGLDDEKPVVIDNFFRISHTGLTKAGYRCVECHAATAHKVSEQRLGRATMSMCARCHNNVKETGACETCHVGKKSPDVARRVDVEWSKTHGANWQSTHGMGDLQTCTLCHERAKCESCHNMPLPHEKNFLATHGKLAIQPNAPCLSCHKGSLCESCHGIEMPHPDNFLAKHSSVAVSAKDPRCKTCHPMDACTRCHERHVHPGGAGL